jgi:hypothetical protein
LALCTVARVSTVWERRGEELHCARHGATYGLTESCPGCNDDPGPLEDDVDDAIPDPPAGCMSSLELERQLAVEVEVIRKMARDAAKPEAQTRWTVADADRLWNTYLKGTRQLLNLAARREDAEMVRRYERRLRARGASH